MLHRALKIVALLLCILPLPFCKKGQSQHRDISLINPDFNKKLDGMLRFTVPLMSVDELFDQHEEVFLIDAREKEEYDVSHIANAHYGGDNEFNISNFDHLPKDTTIVLYCSIGYRSEKIAEKMQRAGFTNVYNLYGSIFEWVNAEYPVVSPDGNKADEVHTYNKKWGQWVDESKIKKIY